MAEPPHGPSILIVDSDPVWRRRVQSIVEQSRLEAAAVESLLEARQAMRTAFFPLVILDRDLGEGDGGDLCSEYRARHFGKHIRILMLSAVTARPSATSALAAGADDNLVKDCPDAELAARILRLYRIAGGPPPTPQALDAESARLRELHELHILDTPAEPAYDDLTRIAALVCDAPMAMVSLVDERRQWFKSAFGLTVREVPREQAFTTYAIEKADVFVVNDATLDSRFADSPLVRGRPGLRFYAGVPLITSSGIAIGALCVMDRKPRQLEAKAPEILVTLGRQVTGLLEGRRGQSQLQDALVARRTSDADLARAQAMFREAFENAPIGIALVSIHGEWLRVNRSMSEIVGYGAEELQRSTFQAITHPEDLNTDLARMEELLEGRIAKYEIEKRYIHRGGHVVCVSLHVSLVRDDQGQPLYFVSQVQDITDRKHLERARSEFVGVVSHELRTPITAIRGSLGLLAANAAGCLPAKARELVDLADRNAQRLHRLIDDILDLDKMDSGNFRYELGMFEVDGFVERAIEVMRPYAAQFKVEVRQVTAPISTRIKADERRVQQVITNLIANAVKFSPTGGLVEIAIERLAATIRFQVTDHGPGIPLEYQSALFKRFGQAPMPSVAPVSGTGLGLNICKNIVEAHGGRIGFTTADGGGTTFWFELNAIGAPV